MTVGQLIKELQKIDNPDMKVVQFNQNGWRELEKVEVLSMGEAFDEWYIAESCDQGTIRDIQDMVVF